MSVTSQLFAVPLARWRALLGGGDAGVASRLEAAWFGQKVVAEEERIPDRALISGMISEGKLYDELDDETGLRLDMMIIMLLDKELGGELLPLSPMRDDLQLLVRAIRESGKDTGIADLLSYLANGRRFGGGDEPIDVPHYSYLELPELRRLDEGISRFLEAARPKGFFAKLTGGKPALAPEQEKLMASLQETFRHVAAKGQDVVGVNRDLEARWDMV